MQKNWLRDGMLLLALAALGVFAASRSGLEDAGSTLEREAAAAVDETNVAPRIASRAKSVDDTGSGEAPSGGERDVAPRVASADGEVEGVVTYKADSGRRWRQARYYVEREGRLTEAVVALRAARLEPSRRDLSPRTWTIDQKNYQFTPETLAIRARDSVRFTNGDPAVHNVRTLDGRRPFNISLTSGSEYVHRFPKAGGVEKPVRLGCVFHGSMRAWIYVFGHAFFRVTTGDGRFHFKGVPPGKYWVDMVHPAGGLRWSRKIEIKSGGTSKVEISVSPDDTIKKKRDPSTNEEGAR